VSNKSQKQLILSLEADSDLEDIFIYTYSTWGPESAASYLDKIDQSISLLLEYPHAGTKRDNLFAGCRCLRSQHHLIFYRLIGQNIEIVRILHEKCEYKEKIDHTKPLLS